MTLYNINYPIVGTPRILNYQMGEINHIKEQEFLFPDFTVTSTLYKSRKLTVQQIMCPQMVTNTCRFKLALLAEFHDSSIENNGILILQYVSYSFLDGLPSIDESKRLLINEIRERWGYAISKSGLKKIT